MTKIEAVGSKQNLENKAEEQDWKGTTMTKTEAVRDVEQLPKDKQGMLKNDNTVIDSKKHVPTKKAVPFEPAAQTSPVGSRSIQTPEQRRREDVERYQKVTSLPASATNESPKGTRPYRNIGVQTTSPFNKESTVAEKVEDMKDKAVEKGREMKDKALEKGKEMKDRAMEEGERIKERATMENARMKARMTEKEEEAKRMKENIRQRGEEAKERVREEARETKQDIRQKGWEFKNEAEKRKKEAEDWIRLEKELAKNKVQQGERKVEEGKERLTSGIKSLENKVIEEVKDFGTAVVGTTHDVKEGLQQMGEDVKEGAQARWQEFKGKLSETPKNIVEEGEYLGKVVKDKATEIGEKAKDSIWTAEQKAKEAVWGTEEKAKAKAREADRKLKETGQRAKETATEVMEEGRQKLKEGEKKGKEALYDTQKKAEEYGRRAKETMGEKKKEVTDSMGDLKGRIEESIRYDIDKMYGAKDKLTDEFKREAYYARDKAEELWEGGKQEVKNFGTAVKETAQDVKEGLTPKSATPTTVPVTITKTTSSPPQQRAKSNRSTSFGESIDRAFTTTPDTNRPVMSDFKWTTISKENQPDMTPMKTVLSDETKTREILRDQVIQEEKRSPGFVASVMEFVFGPSRSPDVVSSPTVSEDELKKQKLTRLNTVAYSPAGTIVPSDYEEEKPLEKMQLPSLRRHSIAGGELDAETARKFDRYAGFQYSPAIGAPTPSEVYAKEQPITRELPTYRPTQIPITTSTTPERPVRILGMDMNLGTPNNLPESATSSYFQTYHRAMPSEEVEERVLESTIDFFY